MNHMQGQKLNEILEELKEEIFMELDRRVKESETSTRADIKKQVVPQLQEHFRI